MPIDDCPTETVPKEISYTCLLVQLYAMTLFPCSTVYNRNTMLPGYRVSPSERQVYLIPPLLCVCVSLLSFHLAALVRSVPELGKCGNNGGTACRATTEYGRLFGNRLCIKKSIKGGSRLKKPCSVVVKVNVSQSSLIWILFCKSLFLV